MANDCMTLYTIISKDKDSLEHLIEAFEKARGITAVENDFGPGWIGNVLSYLGLSEKEVLDSPCKGTIDVDHTIDFDEETKSYNIQVFSETAWEPMPDAVIKMVEKYAPGSKILYSCEVPLSDYFVTNDTKRAGTPYEGDLEEDRDDDVAYWEYVPLEEL